MRIVYNILNTWYSGGLTRVLANKANYLAEHGYEVYIITTDQLGKEHFYTMSDKINFIDLAINYHLHDQEGLIGKLIHLPKKIIRHRVALSKVLNELKADIVISLFGKEAFFLPKLQDGSKKILEAHGARLAWTATRVGILGRLQNDLDLRLIRRFDRFVVLTEVDKENWGAISGMVAISNPNTFESETVSSLENKVVLAAGRYNYEKNFESLLRAWAIVYQKFPDWELRLRGEGLEQLNGVVSELGVESSVSIGNTKDMLSEYLDSSLFVLSSRWEGLGLVLLEAQVCGVPLVAYAAQCGPLEVITDGENGFLVEVNDHEALAERMMLLMGSLELRQKMGKAAKLHSKRFTEDVIMKKWEELFKSLVHE